MNRRNPKAHTANAQSARDLYPRVMGKAFLELSPPVQNLHMTGAGKSFQGRCTITRGLNIPAQVIATLFNFPRACPNIDLNITVTRRGETEQWQRHFGSHPMQTAQMAGRGKYEGCIIERFGPARIYLKLVVIDAELHLITAAWSILGIKLPLFLAPSGTTYEHGSDHRYNFHVDVTLPIIGRLVKYEGWLVETSSAPIAE